MIEPQILYGVTCDRCGETLINENDNCAWFDRNTAEDEASEADWHSVSGHHYCPNCYREDDESCEDNPTADEKVTARVVYDSAAAGAGTKRK